MPFAQAGADILSLDPPPGATYFVSIYTNVVNEDSDNVNPIGFRAARCVLLLRSANSSFSLERVDLEGIASSATSPPS